MVYHKVSYMNLLLEVYLSSKRSVDDLGEQSNGDNLSHEQLYTGLQRIHILKSITWQNHLYNWLIRMHRL